MSAAGVHIVKVARAGKPTRWYLYAWRGGPAIRVAVQPQRPVLTREDIAAIAAAHEADRAPKDTVAGLCLRFRKTPYWRGLAASTRKSWDFSLDAIERQWGTVPLRLWSDPRMTVKVVKWRDAMAGTPRGADEHVKVLKLMLDWAQLNGLVSCNVAAPVPRLWKGGNREEIVWLPEDEAAFDAVTRLAKDPAPRWIADARRLAAYTGLRRADIAALTWREISETHIARTAAKKSAGRRKRTVMPIVPGLAELLAELRTRPRKAGVDNVLVGMNGGPLLPRTITAEFIKCRNRANGGAGIKHLAEADDEQPRDKTLHDLRGTFATKLMTLPGGSLTDAQIALIMGWTERQVAAIRRRYVDEATIVVAIGQRIAEAL